MASPSSRAFYAGVFTISGLLMTTQILQSRIFSVTTWYHLSFLVISVAMFGLTLGALKVHRSDEKETRENYARTMADASFAFAVSNMAALAAQMMMPIVSSDLSYSLVALPVMAVFTLVPYYCAGIVLTLAMTRAPFPPARTYGYDLLGAAAGCLFALGVMNAVDGASAVLVVSLCAVAASYFFAKTEKFRAGFVALVALVALVVNVVPAKPPIHPLFFKDHHLPSKMLVFDKWNPISRIIVLRERQNSEPFLWGPSPALPRSLKSWFYELIIDGDAGTPIMKWSGKDRGQELRVLDYDVTTVAYAIPGMKSAGVIGLGGGRDVMSALHAGIDKVTALDVNAIQVSLLTRVEPYKSYANLSWQPGVRLINSEARSWFAHNPDKFDLIQMSLVDTWAATGAGAFALSENGLYTVDAWKTFINHLNPGGVMTVSRWYLKDVKSEGERLLSLAVGALFEAGVTDPAKHIFMATADRIVTLVLSRDDFTPAQLDAMEKRVKQKAFGVLVSPRKKAPQSEFAAILATKNMTELQQLADASVYDISPPTDLRPFFFNQVRLSNPLLVWKLAFADGMSAIIGHARAIMNLYLIIAFSFLMVVFTILYPLGKALKGQKGFIGAGTAWFALIGLGFMLLEISLLQRMSVYLGHPSYGLGIVLFSLVLSTGCGSLICDRFPLKTNNARTIWALSTAAMIVAAVFFIGAAMKEFADVSLVARAALCLSLTLPLGCLMGFGFPTGMAMTMKENPPATAWFWGINGAAGVMGGSLAIALNIATGIDHTMFVAALCYALLVLPGRRPA